MRPSGVVQQLPHSRDSPSRPRAHQGRRGQEGRHCIDSPDAVKCSRLDLQSPAFHRRYDVELVNRVALVVTPKRRYAEWTRSVAPDAPRLGAEQLKSMATVFVVEALEGEPDVHADERARRTGYDVGGRQPYEALLGTVLPHRCVRVDQARVARTTSGPMTAGS